MKSYVFDIECYKNYFLVQFKDIYSGEVFFFEKFGGNPFPVVHIQALCRNRIVGFNSKNYDIPMLSYACAGATNIELKQLSDAIILQGKKWWELEREFGFCCSGYNHIDLMEVAPGQAGLKTYGGRMHSQKLQDLPIEPDAEIDESEHSLMRQYCKNDLDLTIDLYHKLLPQLKLRASMSKQYGVDLLSKSDAQIAETVIIKEIEKITGNKVYKPRSDKGKTFKYKMPDFIKFETEELQALLKDVEQANFGVDASGKMLMPDVLHKRVVVVGGKPYAMGIGGLHSMEKSGYVHSKEYLGMKIFDRDVTSYYPSIILNQSLYPAHIGEAFLTVYKSLVDRRVEAKKNGDSVTADSLKIAVNGSYGKLGSIWSKLFAPELLIQTTITGQLSLLMLIEMFSTHKDHGVYSANTDGITVTTFDVEDYLRIVKKWEKITGFNTEETEYLAVYSRDVNNYVAVKSNGKVKTKGAYTTGGLMKNPVNKVCVDAVVNYLTKKMPIEDTIKSCTEIKDFLTVRKVEGGAVWRDQYLGKSIRWYYSHHKDTINYKTNGNKVAKSEGATPMMELIGFPEELNHQWYIDEAKSMLGDLHGAR